MDAVEKKCKIKLEGYVSGLTCNMGRKNTMSEIITAKSKIKKPRKILT